MESAVKAHEEHVCKVRLHTTKVSLSAHICDDLKICMETIQLRTNHKKVKQERGDPHCSRFSAAVARPEMYRRTFNRGGGAF